MFYITLHKGFQVDFGKCKLSVQFGPGNYCENYNMEYDKPKTLHTLQSQDAEIAIISADGDWLTRKAYLDLFGEEHHDDVDGNVDTKKFSKLVAWCQAYSEGK